MSAMRRPRGPAAPNSIRSVADARRSHVVAVVGGALDPTVVDLARALIQQSRTHLDLLVLAEVPALFPLRVYGERVVGPAAERALNTAEQPCAEIPGESEIILCRDMASALVAEIRARDATDVVLSAPTGNWWRQWRLRRAIARLREGAECRVYVVHTRAPEEAAPADVEPSGRAMVP